MRNKIIDRHFDAFALFQLLDRFNQQIKIKSVWMVEIVFVVVRQLGFLGIKDLQLSKSLVTG